MGHEDNVQAPKEVPTIGASKTKTLDRPRPSSSRSPIANNNNNKSAAAIDITNLAEFVGDETAATIAAGGPYEPRHIRTIAHNLKQLEHHLREARDAGAPPSKLQPISKTYLELQNHYYAALNKTAPYQPDPEASEHLARYRQALEENGAHMTKKERQLLKRKLLLRKAK